MENSKYSCTVLRGEDGDVELLLVDGALIRLEDIRGRPCDAALDEFENNIKAKSAILSALNKLNWSKAAADAGAALSIARSSVEAAETRLNLLRIQLAKSGSRLPVPVLTLIAIAIAIIVGAATEIGLCWSVLPSLVDVQPTSVLGILMGGVTLLLTVSLEQLLDRIVLMLGESLQGPSGRGRRLASLWAYLGTTSFAVFNIFALVKIGMARAEAAKLIQALLDITQAEMPHIDPAIATSTVIWVGIVTVLDSSLLLRMFLHGLDDLLLRRREAYAEAEFTRLGGILHAAKSKDAEIREWNDRADRHASDLASASESHDFVRLEEIRARQSPPRERLDLADVVDGVLRHSVPLDRSGDPPIPGPPANISRVQ